MGTESKNQEAMMWPDEPLIDSHVRYILDLDGKLFVFENVPARVNTTTGEQFFSPATVRKIQEIALSSYSPTRTVQANVYEWEKAA
jgi:hypothetical protein